MPDLDRDLFNKRIKKLYSYWQSNKNSTENVDAICVVTGGDSESAYYKTTAVQQWLFGVEITDSIIVFCDKYIIFVASPKKLQFFKQIEGGKENENGMPKYKFINRDKNDEDKIFLRETIDLIKKSKSGKSIGIFSKDKYEGDFIKDWTKAVDDAKFEKIDICSMIASVLAIKDDAEVNHIKKACEITTKIFSKCLKDQIVTIIDSEKKVKHSKLSESVEQALSDTKYVAQSDSQYVEICYPAIIQSGGNYNLKFSAVSDKNNLHFGTIICALGVRYKNYCSNIVRTMLVEPSQSVQDNYKYLMTIEDELTNNLCEGVKLCDLYEKVRSKVQNDRPELVDKLTANLGFAIGIEFREPNYLISNKCTAVAKKGMVFQISIGFSDLKNDDAKDDESKKYALFIGDTVSVNDENQPATLLTTSKKKIENIAIFLKEDDEEEEEEEEENKKSPKKATTDILPRGRRAAILQNKTRADNNQEQARKQHQKDLSKKLNEEAKERLLSQKGAVAKEKVRKAAISYKNPSQFPQNKPEIEQQKIYVDKARETVILPILGSPAPFHISTIKNLSTSVEGDYTYLRINFFHPGAAINKVPSEVPSNAGTGQDIIYIKEMTYRASNNKDHGEISAPSTNLNLAFKYIKDMQKEFKEKEHEEKEKEGMVKQDTLILSTKQVNPKLKDLYLKPNLVQKRIPGVLEAHTNGFLYTSTRGDKVEILYNNIKHAVFQPCDKEIIILIHFHLKHAIMFGKKKQLDIQFYTDVGETITDLGKHRGGDKDDLIAEQAERELRKKLNLAFKAFIDKVEAITSNQVGFELPFRDLGFNGTPFRSMVLLQPTGSCLLNIIEWPPFILTLDEVELVHFERVSFHLKNFDMVFVFKDYARKVSQITSIPMNQLDQIKDWLNSCDIYYTEGIQNFNWSKIMKTITDDPEGFFENGGWQFLSSDSDTEDKAAAAAEDDDISDEDDDAYTPTDSGDEEGSDDDESDYSEDEISDSDDGDESGASDELDSDEESGKDWSDLEEEARKADAEVDEDDSPRDKKGGRKRPAETKKANTSAKKSRR